MKTVNRMMNLKQFKEALWEAERLIYRTAYEHAKCNQSEAARTLGVSRTTFINKMKEYLR
jgi:DNA-binding NtrC family response regulator